MAEACEAFDTPVVSGNVSFYNESFGQRHLPDADGRHAGRHGRREQALRRALQGRGRRRRAAGPPTAPGSTAPSTRRSHYGRVEGRVPDVDLDARGRAAAHAARRPSSARPAQERPRLRRRRPRRGAGRVLHRQRRPTAPRADGGSAAGRSAPPLDRCRAVPRCAPTWRSSARRPPASSSPARPATSPRWQPLARPTLPPDPRLGRGRPAADLRLYASDGAASCCAVAGRRGAATLPTSRSPSGSPDDPSGLCERSLPRQLRRLRHPSPRDATSPASPSSASTPCSTAARRAPASPWPTTARSRSSRTSASSRQVFNEQMLAEPHRQHAIGHVRYSTTGASHWQNSQPLVTQPQRRASSPWATTATSSTPPSCATSCSRQGVKFSRHHRHRGHHRAHRPARRGRPARARSARRSASIRGAFSAAVLSGDAVVGFRDPYGVRPLCLGDFEGHPVIASEIVRPRHHRRRASCARSSRARSSGRQRATATAQRARRARPARARPCASSSSSTSPGPTRVMYGRRWPTCRFEMGRHLAHGGAGRGRPRHPGARHRHARRPSATPRASGIPYTEGLIKNRYVHRTFIQPDDQLRQLGIRMKLNPLTLGHRGQAPGRGRRLDRARQHHRASSSTCSSRPAPARCTCASARRPSSAPASTASTWPRATSSSPPSKSVDEIRAHVGATTLHYLTLEGLQASRPACRASQFCRACFDGDYPIAVPEELAMCKMRFEGGPPCQPSAPGPEG